MKKNKDSNSQNQDVMISILKHLEQVKCESCNQFPIIDIDETIKELRVPNKTFNGVVFNSICCDKQKSKINCLFLELSIRITKETLHYAKKCLTS